jgi:hypothetical protein
MASDFWITEGDKKIYVGVITKVNDDGTVEVQTNAENILKLFELRPDLIPLYLRPPASPPK